MFTRGKICGVKAASDVERLKGSTTKSLEVLILSEINAHAVKVVKIHHDRRMHHCSTLIPGIGYTTPIDTTMAKIDLEEPHACSSRGAVLRAELSIKHQRRPRNKKEYDFVISELNKISGTSIRSVFGLMDDLDLW